MPKTRPACNSVLVRPCFPAAARAVKTPPGDLPHGPAGHAVRTRRSVAPPVLVSGFIDSGGRGAVAAALQRPRRARLPRTGNASGKGFLPEVHGLVLDTFRQANVR